MVVLAALLHRCKFCKVNHGILKIEALDLQTIA